MSFPKVPKTQTQHRCNTDATRCNYMQFLKCNSLDASFPQFLRCRHNATQNDLSSVIQTLGGKSLSPFIEPLAKSFDHSCNMKQKKFLVTFIVVLKQCEKLLSCTNLLAVQTCGNLICKSGSHSREMITSNGTGH